MGDAWATGGDGYGEGRRSGGWRGMIAGFCMRRVSLLRHCVDLTRIMHVEQSVGDA